MTSYFPDVNAWLALSWDIHSHHQTAKAWFQETGDSDRLLFSRYSQLGLLRLMTNAAVMGDSVMALNEAMQVYDRWLEDGRVELLPEPHNCERIFRGVCSRLRREPATKAIGDAYLASFSEASAATLVTFDKALARVSKFHGFSVLMLSR